MLQCVLMLENSNNGPKQCCRCKRELPVAQFNKRLDGLNPACKECLRIARVQQWRELSPKQREERRVKQQYWRQQNKERVNAKIRARYQQDPDKKIRANKEWKEANKEVHALLIRRSHLARRGLTLELYASMIEAQEGKCAICQQGSNKRLAVDHDHVTGRVRGLLCWKCNGALGILGEDHLRAALDYLGMP